MEFKVGSLSNLISGKSGAKGSTSQSGEQKIVYQQKPKVALAKPKKASNEKQTPNQLNDPKSHKPQHNIKNSNSRAASFKRTFKRGALNKSFKKLKLGQGSKPEVVENTSESVVGKSFKYLDSESNSKTEDAVDGPRDPEKLERTLFVGNLPLTQISEKAISNLFSKFGEIDSFRLRSIPLKDLRVPKKVTGITKNFHPDRTNTNAYVVMVTKEAAEAALALNGTVVDDHHLRVDTAVASAERDPRKAVFLGNVSFKAEEDDLWNLFEQCGEIDSIRILRDPTTSVAKGVAYVNFKSADSVELALKLNGTAEIHDRPVKIHRCLPGRTKLQAASSRQPGLRNTDEADDNKEKTMKTMEEKRFQKKMKRREKREAENAKNEALGQRSRPFKDPASTEAAAKSFVGVKAADQQQKKKKKRFNKGEVQRKKVAKILANPKPELKNGEPQRVAEMDVEPTQSTSSEAVASPAKKSKKAKAPSAVSEAVAPPAKKSKKAKAPSTPSSVSEAVVSPTKKLKKTKAPSTPSSHDASTSKKMKKTLSKVIKKAKPKAIVIEENGQLKKKKLKNVKSKGEKKVVKTGEPKKKKAKISKN